jgi:hypothetical protein
VNGHQETRAQLKWFFSRDWEELQVEHFLPVQMLVVALRWIEVPSRSCSFQILLLLRLPHDGLGGVWL